MPELPEVEVTRLGLLPYILHQKIMSIRLNHKQLRTVIPEALLQDVVQGGSITAVDRRAKYLLLRIDNGAVLIIHLGMSGKLGLFQQKEPEKKHDHVIFQFASKLELRFNDTRRFGSISVWPPDQAEKLEKNFSDKQGIEPLSDNFNTKILLKLAQNRKVALKYFLMNSQIIAGIGNIYANEILFAVSLHPATPIHSVNEQNWQKIIDTSRKILQKAIQAGGSTIADFVGSSGKPGYFQLQLKAYGQHGKKCCFCSDTIKKIQLGGRACYICPSCQKL
jgi:formamidopyrimidine-DNA glycosylase